MDFAVVRLISLHLCYVHVHMYFMYVFFLNTRNKPSYFDLKLIRWSLTGLVVNSRWCCQPLYNAAKNLFCQNVTGTTLQHLYLNISL